MLRIANWARVARRVVVFGFGFAVHSVGAQAPTASPTGRIVGKVVDGATGNGIAEAQIQVVGTMVGTASGVGGRFTLTGVPAGTVTLQVRRIGFSPKTVTGLVLAAGQALEQNIALSAVELKLAAVVVTSQKERGSVSEALDAQKKAAGVVSSIGQEQIAKSPDGDAAQAIQRVSGVTVQDGRSVFVRGLGERYTTTSLNGARLPSPEPEKRFVPLDLFPSGLLQSIKTYKTFTPELSGDFSGAAVDIETREFPANRVTTLSFSVGANDAATGRALPTAPGLAGDWLAAGAGERRLPDALRTGAAIGQLITRPQVNGAIRSLRNAWTPQDQTGLPNFSASASIGGQDPLFGQRIGYLASLTYSATQEVRADDYMSNPIPRNNTIEVLESWRGAAGRRSNLLGGMLNLSTLVGSNLRIALNNTYTRSSDNEARLNVGPTQAFSLGIAERATLRYVERVVRSSQLKMEYEGRRNTADVLFSVAGVRRLEPDRADRVYAQFAPNTPFAWSDGNPDVGRRTFGDLSESNWSAGANWRHAFGSGARVPALKAGGLFRSTSRSAFNRQFSLLSTSLSQADRQLSAEQLFSRFTTDTSTIFNIQNVSEDGVYDASERLGAGYAMVDLPIGERVQVITGVRVESAQITVNTSLTNNQVFRSRLDNTDPLPALVVNVRVREDDQLRFSASQTLARPEYRELSPVQYLEVIGGAITRGNDQLVRTLVQNYDIKYETYPAPGEVFSIGLFAKTFDRPIERIDLATGGAPIVSFFNAAGARNVGVEVEARKGLGFLGRAFENYGVFSNATFMRSRIEIGTGATANTNASRPMMGQAPWVVNAGVTWTSARRDGLSGTLLYGAVGPRIFSAGTVPFPDTYEQPRHLVDLSLRVPMGDAMQWRLDLRNLLDAPYRLTQGPTTREEYRLGRQVSVGMTWRP